MYSDIIKLIQSDDHFGISRKVDIAKGFYEAHHNMHKWVQQIKRTTKWQKKSKGN